MNEIALAVEALIFVSPKSVSKADIVLFLSSFFQRNQAWQDTEVEELLGQIKQKHETENSIMELVEIDEGYKFLTKRKFEMVLDFIYGKQKARRLSRSALETLAIVAYKHPVTKQEIEHVRGVNSDYSVDKLLEKELIKIVGKADLPGRPLLYSIGDKFLEHLGINSLQDLPKLKDMNFIESDES